MIHAAKIDWIEAKYVDGNDQLIFQDDDGQDIASFELPNGLLRAFVNDKAASSVWARPDGLIYSIVDDPDPALDHNTSSARRRYESNEGDGSEGIGPVPTAGPHSAGEFPQL